MFFDDRMQDMTIFKNVDRLIQEYQSKVAENEYLEQLVREIEITEEVFHSNAIENSSLSLDETQKIIEDMVIERSTSIREIFEAKNLNRVYNYLLDKKPEINRENILRLHKFLISNIDESIAGRFRKIGEGVRVGEYIAPKSKFIELMIGELLSRKISTLRDIAIFHIDFERVHPFIDGNGRIGRVLINWQLNSIGLPSIIVRSENKFEDYYPHISEVKYEALEEQFSYYLSESLNKRLAYFDSLEIIRLKEYVKMTDSTLSAMLQKAHRQTIPAVRLKGKWHIGVENK